MHLKPHFHEVLNYLLHLRLIRHVLHRHNHKKISASSSSCYFLAPSS
jgi:hypothetical protein